MRRFFELGCSVQLGPNRRARDLWRRLLAAGVLPVLVAMPTGAAPAGLAVDPHDVPLERLGSSDRRALIVGVNQYRDTNLHPLSYAVKDAYDFAEFVKAKWLFKNDELVLLPNAPDHATEEPTIEKLKSRHDWLVAPMGSASVRLFFFSGHGVTDGETEEEWLIPSDGSLASLKGNAFPPKRLYDTLERLRVQRAVLFVDACRNLAPRAAVAEVAIPAAAPTEETKGSSPPAGESADTTAKGSPGPTISNARGLGLLPGVTGGSLPASTRSEIRALFACKPGQQSQEDSRLEHGLFTYFLLKGLSGEAAREDGIVTFHGLANYITNAIPPWAKANLGVFAGQEPGILSDGTEDIALVQAFARPPLKDARLSARIEELKQRAYNLLEAVPPDEDGATRVAQELLSLNPRDFDGHLVLGTVFLHQGKRDDAIRELGQAVEINPNDRTALARYNSALTSSEQSSRSFGRGAGEDRLRQAPFQQGLPIHTVSLVRQVERRPVAATAAGEARRLIEDGRPAEAEIEAHVAVGEKREAADAHYVLGRVYAGRGDLDRAIQEYQEALCIQPDVPGARAALGAALANKGPADPVRLARDALYLVKAGQFEDAEVLVREALARFEVSDRPAQDEEEWKDGRGRAHYTLGRIYSVQGRNDEALQEYDRAQPLVKTDLIGLVEARTAARQARATQEEAEKAYELVVQNNLKAARRQVGKISGRGGELATVHFVRARLAFRDRKYPDALREYQDALFLDPALSEAREGVREVLVKLKSADVPRLIQDASTLLGRGQVGRAEAAAREAVARAPEQAQAHLALARVFERQKRYGDAARAYAVAQREDPGLPEARDGLRKATAALLTEQAYGHLVHLEFLDARDKAQRAIALDGVSVKAHAVLANVWLELDEMELGQAEIQQAGWLDSLDREPVRHVALGLSYWLQGELTWRELYAIRQEEAALERHGKPDRARLRELNDRAKRLVPQVRTIFAQAASEFRHALKLDSQNILARNGLGASYYMLEHYPEAVREFRSVLKIESYHVTYYNLGNAYFAQRCWKEARQAYEKVIDLYDANAGAYAQLASTLIRLKHVDEAFARAREAQQHGLLAHDVFQELALLHRPL